MKQTETSQKQQHKTQQTTENSIYFFIKASAEEKMRKRMRLRLRLRTVAQDREPEVEGT